MVWTATGAPPPIGTPPTHIWRLEAMLRGYPSPHAATHARAMHAAMQSPITGIAFGTSGEAPCHGEHASGIRSRVHHCSGGGLTGLGWGSTCGPAGGIALVDRGRQQLHDPRPCRCERPVRELERRPRKHD